MVDNTEHLTFRNDSFSESKRVIGTKPHTLSNTGLEEGLQPKEKDN